MIGTGSRHIVLGMAIDTIIPNPVESQCGFGCMAVCAGRVGMRAHQRKAVVVVQFSNVVHQPVFRVMTPGAVGSNGLVVHIGVAGNTFQARIRKNQGLVAVSAIRPRMLAG